MRGEEDDEDNDDDDDDDEDCWALVAPTSTSTVSLSEPEKHSDKTTNQALVDATKSDCSSPLSISSPTFVLVEPPSPLSPSYQKHLQPEIDLVQTLRLVMPLYDKEGWDVVVQRLDTPPIPPPLLPPPYFPLSSLPSDSTDLVPFPLAVNSKEPSHDAISVYSVFMGMLRGVSRVIFGVELVDKKSQMQDQQHQQQQQQLRLTLAEQEGLLGEVFYAVLLLLEVESS